MGAGVLVGAGGAVDGASGRESRRAAVLPQAAVAMSMSGKRSRKQILGFMNPYIFIPGAYYSADKRGWVGNYV